MSDNSRVCLSVRGLTKIYGGTIALSDANLEFEQGEIHALVGENGAGKSTLCKMLAGAISPDRGTIELNGKEFTKFTPKEAKDYGIGMIYQEFNLINEMPIYENLFIGKELRKGLIVQKSEMIKKAREVFDSLGIALDPKSLIRDISVAYCQIVEIGKSLLEDKKILIMDEPTAPLTNHEVEILFNLIKKLKASGITIIYISHRMEEVLELTDRVTILRDGAVIKTLKTRETNTDEIIRLMIGRESSSEFPERIEAPSDGEVILSVKDLKNKKLKGISFDLHRGEILGLSGLVGAGRTEVVRAIFGADRIESGAIEISGKQVTIKTPKHAIQHGLALIPEDRKREGIHLDMTIRQNISFLRLRQMSKFIAISSRQEKRLSDEYLNTLSIKTSSVENEAKSLSGGNQQKVVVAKWLATKADVLIFDEPTRGIDVGAKSEIYELMNGLRAQGKAILMVSSEMHEIIGMCDRTLVLYEGKMMGELSREEMTQARIMEYASGLE